MAKLTKIIVTLSLLAATGASAAPVVYYSFNDTNVTAQTGSAISTFANFNPGAKVLTFTAGSTRNAQAGVAAGVAVTQTDWNTAGSPAYFQFTFNTRNYRNLIVSFWEQKSSTGPGTFDFQYSVNRGASFVTVASLTASNTPGNVHTQSFSAVTALNNNPDVVFRLSSGTASSAAGTFRIDNLTIDAVAAPPPPARLTIDGGGKRATSAGYTMDLSVAGIGGISAAANDTAKHGYIGQLPGVSSVSVTSAPATANETSTSQLRGTATMDDATVTVLSGSDVTWNPPAFPIASIATNGLATTSAVYQNTSGPFSGRYFGVLGTGSLLVLDSIPDNYGSYANDGIPDSWQYQYFGLNNPHAAPNMDADGTGQNNMLKYLAGLDPTNAASVFVLSIANVPGQPNQTTLKWKPWASGRSYTPEFKTDLGIASYTTLTGYSGPYTNGSEVGVTDLNATGNAKYYRIKISIP